MKPSQPQKVLFVDDNVNLLAGIKRQFRKRYDTYTAEGGQAGLDAIQKHGPFAVIVCDMKMPDMNGIQFFTHAQRLAPATIRIMLTGNADLETAMHAVNEGNIFRFLMKPCEKATIEWAVDSGIEYYDLKKVEKELLEKTLQGCVHALTDMLSLTNPLAFSQASRVSGYVKRMVTHMSLKNQWMYELASSLSQIGCISVPRDTLERVFAGGDLTKDEKEMYERHPIVGRELVCAIPRLEIVGEIIGSQLSWTGGSSVTNIEDRTVVDIGSEILSVILEFDNMLCRGISKNQAITDLKKSKPHISEEVVKALKIIEVADSDIQTRMVKIHDLTNEMVIAEDLFSRQGTLIASQGQELNHTVRTLLANYVLRKEIDEEIRVYFRVDQSLEKQGKPTDSVIPAESRRA